MITRSLQIKVDKGSLVHKSQLHHPLVSGGDDNAILSPLGYLYATQLLFSHQEYNAKHFNSFTQSTHETTPHATDTHAQMYR